MPARYPPARFAHFPVDSHDLPVVTLVWHSVRPEK